MTEEARPTGRTDIQGLFEASTGKRDFISAGKVDDAIGLCLSGGGYRAMLYHAGALVRLNELGFLPRLGEIASVSGGSITAGVLACAWSKLDFDANGRSPNFIEQVVRPIVGFAGIGIDIKAILIGLLPCFTAAGQIAGVYDRYLFKGVSLQDIPQSPRFTFMATNLQTGSGWRFARDYAADHRVGRIDNPSFSIAEVVAASSAFPPFLSPVRFKFKPGEVKEMVGTDLHKSPFTDVAILTDGGIYDNLGLERVWRRCRTVLVSNGGATTPEIGFPTRRWFGQTYRVLSIVQKQVESSRLRLLFGMGNSGQRKVAYWNISTPISAFRLKDAVPLADDVALQVGNMRTRLNPFSAYEIELLLRSGYAGSDASIRASGIAENSPVADAEQFSTLAAL